MDDRSNAALAAVEYGSYQSKIGPSSLFGVSHFASFRKVSILLKTKVRRMGYKRSRYVSLTFLQ